MKLSELGHDAQSRARLLGVSERQVELTDTAMALVEMVGRLLADMREKEGLTQAELAERIGLAGAGRISQLESGQLRHAVNLKTLAKIAAATGYDLTIEATKAAKTGSVRVEVGVADGNRTAHVQEIAVAAIEAETAQAAVCW